MALTLVTSIDTDPHESDADLITAYQSGDPDAFRRLYANHCDRVYTIAVYFLNGDRTSAEDVTQDVFVKLYTALPGFHSKSEFTTWLFRVVSNCCVDEIRKRRRTVSIDSLPGNLPGVDHDAFNEYSRSDMRTAVQNALSSLGSEARATVLMKYFEDLSYEEIALAMNCKTGTVASRLNRALRVLAEKLSSLMMCDPD